MRLLKHLKWRYATKQFDTSKKVAAQDIQSIKEAIQLSASSYGLQPFKILDIVDPKLREQLRPLAWNQGQITDASHLFVFCNTLEVTDSDVDAFMRLKAETGAIPLESISGYGEFIKGKLKEKSIEDIQHWTAKQTYIALSNAMNACAELQIDSTPMEGFEMEAINKTLALRDKGLSAAVILAIGYRHSEDSAQHAKKVRKPLDTLFEEVL